MRVLGTRAENLRAIKFFRERLVEIAVKLDELEWGFPNGERAIYPTYTVSTHLGDMQIGVPKSWESRIPHLFRFVKDQGPPSPDVEVNIPIDHNRNISGLYVVSNGDYFLCSRGGFTSYRGRIKRAYSLTHFEKWLRDVDDQGKTTRVIMVCALSSPQFADDIGSFVASVQDLKMAYKSADPTTQVTTNAHSIGRPTWGSFDEFEGKKTGGGGARVEYDYLHGPLCNQLSAFLRAKLPPEKSDLVIKNQHLDVAVVDEKSNKIDMIFEVKTAGLPSHQIYSAIGQLNYYKYLYGHSATKLYLVLPLACKDKVLEDFLVSLGISIVYGQSGSFKAATGQLF